MTKTKEFKENYKNFYNENHLYEVYDRGGKRVMFTDSPEAIDDPETISALISTEHKFKINGKTISKTKIIAETKKIKNNI